MMLTRRTILSLGAVAPLAASSLPEQSASLALDRAFPDPGISYFLAGGAKHREICSRWPHLMDPVPVGSLVKPFTALAYGESHAFRFPVYTCRGSSDQCWLPEGHGRMEMSSAIAHSCNAYFLHLAAAVSSQALQVVTERFGLATPSPDAAPGTLIGLGRGWRISPFSISRAYSELMARPADAGVAEILAGMALSARSGTGRGVGPGAYVKTGTAPCMHESRERGDGYVIALYPIAEPRFNLLARVHGVPGARAAYVAHALMRAAFTIL